MRFGDPVVGYADGNLVFGFIENILGSLHKF
jgi:hypothetical protein